MAATFRKHTVRARRNALQGVHSGVVPPMLRTAEAMALTEHDAQSAIDMVGSSGWDAPTRDYWWRGVMMSSSRWHKNTRMTCACCECAVSSFAHTATDCKPWDLLWRWAWWRRRTAPTRDLSRMGGQVVWPVSPTARP